MSDQELVAKQEHVWDTIATLCTPFTEREWKTPTDCSGWSVQDQIAYIVGTESWLLGQPVPAHTPKDMSHVKNELGQWIEPWVDWRRPWPGSMDVETFVCLGCGRWAPEHMLASGKVQIAGDRALAERIVAQMNFMP